MDWKWIRLQNVATISTFTYECNVVSIHCDHVFQSHQWEERITLTINTISNATHYLKQYMFHVMANTP